MLTECRERKRLGEDVGTLICRSYIEESSMSVDAPRSPIRPERVGTAEGRGDEAGD